MRSYFQFVTRHPLPILLIAALVAGGFGMLMFRLERDTSPDAFIPKDHWALLLKQEVEAEFNIREPIAVAVIRDGEGGVFNPHTLTLVRDLTRAIQQLPQVSPEDVLSIATESGVYFEDGEPGFDLLLRQIPEDQAGLAALREDILGYELYRGTLVAADGSAASIIIRPPDQERADELYRRVADLLESPEVRSKLANGERLLVAGEAAVRAHMGVSVSDDALRMNFICPALMALLIIAAYRTVRGTVLPLCVIGGASALSLGSMAAFGVPIFIVTNGIFVIIMALGVADSLHLVGQYYEEQLKPAGRSKSQIVVDACSALWFPIMVTSLTDVAGFFALYMVGTMPPIRYFGLFTCVGVLGALVYSYTVIPAGLMVVPLKTRNSAVRTHSNGSSTRGLDAIGRWMGAVGEVVYRRRRSVLIMGAVVIAGAAWGASKMVLNDARILAFKDDHPIVQANNALNARFDGTSHLNIVVTAAKEGGLLQRELLEKIEALEAFTETLPYVGGTHSPTGWIKAANQKLHEDDPQYYLIPQDSFETQYYLDVMGVETSPMARLLHEVIDESYTRANLIVRMQSSEFIHQREVILAIERYLADHFNDDRVGATLAGRVHLDYHWLGLIRQTHMLSVAFSIGCVLLLTGLMFRSLVAGMLCTLTVGVAVLVNYAVMGWGDIPLGVGTSMFASIAIGAGVNFPIHILDRLRISMSRPGADLKEAIADTLAFTGRALLFTAFIVAVGFLLLCVSEFRTLARFGLLIGIGMLGSFVASVTLLPAAVAALDPRFLTCGDSKRKNLPDALH